jgi:hypothetical protein
MRMAIKTSLALIVALFLITACATGPTSSLTYSVIWDRSLVDGKYQIPEALIRTSDGGYALAGYGSIDLVPGGVGVSPGFWTVRFDRDGKILWQRAFGAEAPKRREEASTLTETRDGGLLVVGTTQSDSLAGRPLGDSNDPRSATSSRVGFAIKYGNDGSLLWKKALDSAAGRTSDWFYAAASLEGGYILAGKTMMHYKDPSTLSGRSVAWVLRVLKLTDSGDVAWDRTIPEGKLSIREESVSRKILPTPDGGFVVAIGPSDRSYRDARKMNIVSDTGKVTGEAAFQRAVILKLDSQGRVVKRSEVAAATEHLALGGNSHGYILSGYDALLWYAFFDSDLNLKWKRAVTHAMRIDAFHPAPDGGFYGVGATSQLAIAHISPSGELRQETIFGAPDGSVGRDVAPGDRPEELVVLWSRIVRTRAGLMKLRVSVQ